MTPSEEEQSKVEEIARRYPEAWQSAGQLDIPLVFDPLTQEDEMCAFLRGIEHAKHGLFSTDETLAPEYEVKAYVTGWRVYLKRSKNERKLFKVE